MHRACNAMRRQVSLKAHSSTPTLAQLSHGFAPRDAFNVDVHNVVVNMCVSLPQ